MKMISAQLKELKDKRKLTNQQLSDLSGIPVGTINRIMAGQTDNPSFQTVCDLVMAMEGSLDELIGIKTSAAKEPLPVNGTITHLYEKTIQTKNKWLICEFICCCALILFIMGIVVYDLLNPQIGFFRR